MRKLVLFMLLMLWISAVIAQDDCAGILEAMPIVAEACAEADSLCLVDIDAEEAFEAEVIGLDDYMEHEDFEAIETISTEDGQSFVLWRLQFNEDALTLLAFGNTRIENSVALTEIEITAIRAVNLRQSPSVADSVIGSLRQGENYIAVGRLEDNTWVQVRLEAGQIGWVSAQFLKTDTGFAELSVVSPNTRVYMPMQAFDLQVDDLCSGVLLVAPENENFYEVAINDLVIQINGAVMVRQTEEMIEVAALAGEAHVTAFGFEQMAEDNHVIYTPLSASGMLIGIPSEAEA